eukprot:scaffold1610_cov257-Pinguiococcus_pyrenoidosus.AAC.59
MPSFAPAAELTSRSRPRRPRPRSKSKASAGKKPRKSSRSKSAKVTRQPLRRAQREDLAAKVEVMLLRLEQKRAALAQAGLAFKRPSIKLLSTELSGITSPKKARSPMGSALHFDKAFGHRKDAVPLLASLAGRSRDLLEDDGMRRNLSTEALPQLQQAGSPHLISSLNDMESMALESLCELSRTSVCEFPRVTESLLPTQLPLWV